MSRRSGARGRRRHAPGHGRLRHHQPSSRWRKRSAWVSTTIVIDHHLADEALPPALAVVNPNRLDDLSKLGHLAAVGLVFMIVAAVNRELRERGFWSESRREPDLLGLLDLVALGTVADVVPLKGLNRAFVAKGSPGAAPARECRADGADGRRAAGRAARALAPRLSARPAHQCGRPHRTRHARRDLLLQADPIEAARIAAELDRLNRERQADRGRDAGAGRGGGACRARPRGARRGRGHRRRGLAPRRGRSGGGAAQGAVRPACFCDRARSGRHRHRIGPLDPRVDLGSAVRQAVSDGLLLKGGGHAMAAGVTLARSARTVSGFSRRRARRGRGGARRTDSLLIDGALTAGAANLETVAAMHGPGHSALAIRSRSWRCRAITSPMSRRPASRICAHACAPATAPRSTPSRFARSARSSAPRFSKSRPRGARGRIARGRSLERRGARATAPDRYRAGGRPGGRVTRDGGMVHTRRPHAPDFLSAIPTLKKERP